MAARVTPGTISSLSPESRVTSVRLFHGAGQRGEVARLPGVVTSHYPGSGHWSLPSATRGESRQRRGGENTDQMSNGCLMSYQSLGQDHSQNVHSHIFSIGNECKNRCVLEEYLQFIFP